MTVSKYHPPTPREVEVTLGKGVTGTLAIPLAFVPKTHLKKD